MAEIGARRISGGAGALSSGEATELLRQLIRNACVNDGSVGSGGERRNADLLASYLDGSGADVEIFEPAPGRASLVARVEGSDKGAPSLLLAGHTDVVPADAGDWRHDPFAGELVDGVVWGRGAVDMLNLVATMAVALRHLLLDGFRPRGDLVLLAAADEEAGGTLGARWLVEHEPEAVRTTYAINELGGMRLPIGQDGVVLPVTVAEKGPCHVRLAVHGRPGHGSLPLASDNAIVLAAEVVRRVEEARPTAVVSPTWRALVEGLRLGEEATRMLCDPAAVEGLTASLEGGLGPVVHACTHTTITPTVLQAGGKHNVVPGRADITLDVRLVPGEGIDGVTRLLDEALGDLRDRVEVEVEVSEAPSTSPIDTPLYEALGRHATALVPGSRVVPFLLPGSTDSRHLRRLGTICYGFGLYSERITFEDFTRMFHGLDERIDVASLDLSVQLWLAVVRDVLGPAS